MQPSSLITWALYIGLAWLIFASCTGADEWIQSLFGKKTPKDLERRIQELEERLEKLEKN